MSNFVTPQTTARQVSLSITNSRSLLKLMSIESVMPSNHLILCHPLLLPSIFPNIRVFPNESVVHIRWPKYWSPHLSMTGEISGLFLIGGPSVRFLTRYDGEVSEPLVGRQGSRVSMRVARGTASLFPSHWRGLWPRDVLKKVSRGLSRVEAGNPGFPRLVQVTSGGFSWWL